MQDGSSVNTSYSGSCTTVTDEALNQRESCSDGLGSAYGRLGGAKSNFHVQLRD